MTKRKVTSFYQRGYTMNLSDLYNAIKKMLKKKIIYTRFDDNVIFNITTHPRRFPWIFYFDKNERKIK